MCAAEVDCQAVNFSRLVNDKVGEVDNSLTLVAGLVFGVVLRDDVDRSASSSVIFGTEAMAETVKALKKRTDPKNRLRFHPFAKFL